MKNTQNVIFHGDNNFEAEFDEKKEEEKWDDEQIELLKGFIDLNCSNNSDSCDDSSKNGKKILVDNNESAAHEQQHSVEDMRENIKPYGLLTALRCQTHLIRDNKVEEISKTTTSTLNAENVSFSPQNAGLLLFSPRINHQDVEIFSFSPQNAENFSFSPRNAAFQLQLSPRINPSWDDEFHLNSQHDNVESLDRKQLLFDGSVSEKQKLRNGGLLWPISTFVIAAKVFNEHAKAKTDASMKILRVRGGGEGVTTINNAWGENTNSLSIAHSPRAVIDQHEYARASKGQQSSSMGKMANTQNQVAISAYSPAFVPATVTDPGDKMLKHIVGDLLACHRDMKSQQNQTKLGQIN